MAPNGTQPESGTPMQQRLKALADTSTLVLVVFQLVILVFMLGITFQRLNALEEWQKAHEHAEEVQQRSMSTQLEQYQRRDVLDERLNRVEDKLEIVNRQLDEIRRKQR